MNITNIPYHPPTNPGVTFLRLIVKPIPKPEEITKEGIYLPSDIGRVCEIGEVISSCPDSAVKPGDKVMYIKIDRKSGEHLDTISIEGEKYDVIFENELYAVNDEPFNLVFAEPLSEMEVTEDGLMLPSGVKGITQKGKVFKAPPHYGMKPGDDIEYRKQERGIYPTIGIEGKNYEVLREWDVFTVNDKVAPYRIIVKIDMVAQRIKRSTADSGLLRSQLFLFMLFNMQCGQVMEIGKEARKQYPELKIGDIVILHHKIEAEQYRLIKKEYGVHDKTQVIYEHRVINAFDKESREILGRVSSRKNKTFLPFGKSVFLDWNFDLFEQSKKSDSLFIDFETNLDKCHAIDDLKSVVKHKTDEGFGKAKAKMNGILQILSSINPEKEKDRYDENETALMQARKEAERIAGHLKKNHLLVCKVMNSNTKVLVPYLELYPINILGKKFLIAYKDYIVAEMMPNLEMCDATES